MIKETSIREIVQKYLIIFVTLMAIPWCIWVTTSVFSNNTFRSNTTATLTELHSDIKVLMSNQPVDRLSAVEDDVIEMKQALRQNGVDHTEILVHLAKLQEQNSQTQKVLVDILGKIGGN